MISLQYLYEYHVNFSDILHVMRVRLRNIPTITGMVIKRARVALRRVNTNARIPGYEEVPLIAGRVPVDFSHRTGFDRHYRCGELAGYGEDCRVDNFDTPADCLVGRWGFGEVVGVGVLNRHNSCGARDVLCRDIGWGFGAREDEEFAGRDILPC